MSVNDIFEGRVRRAAAAIARLRAERMGSPMLNGDPLFHLARVAPHELTAVMEDARAGLHAAAGFVPGEPACFDCQRPYARGPDLVLDDADWRRIAPLPDGEGVLCPNCMHDRLASIGAEPGSVPAVFRSGPFATPTPSPAKIMTTLKAAAHALRSYQYGNAAPDLAREIADDIDTLLRREPGAPHG